MKECPCKGCTFDTGRSPTCHSECERYKEWKAEHDEEREKQRLEQQLSQSSRSPRWYKNREGYWRTDLPILGGGNNNARFEHCRKIQC